MPLIFTTPEDLSPIRDQLNALSARVTALEAAKASTIVPAPVSTVASTPVSTVASVPVSTVVSSVASTPVPQPIPVPPPPPVTGSLADIIAAAPEGWTPLPDTFARVMVPRSSPVSGITGSVSVLVAWNNVAFDGENLYLFGGGHGDYGGNEVYRYALKTLAYERLIEPSLYPPVDPNKPFPYPLSGPPSPHTYDGKIWASAIKRLLTFANGAWTGPGASAPTGDGNVWGFDPEAKVWENLGPNPLPTVYPWAAELPNGNIMLGTNSVQLIWDPRTKTVVDKQDWYADEGEGSAVYDAQRNVVWLSNRFAFQKIALTADYKFASRRIVVSRDYPGGVGSSGSTVAGPKVLRWGGERVVVAYDPEADKWTVYDFATGPSGGMAPYLYDRMFPVAPGVYVAIGNNPNQGPWLFKVPANAGTALPTVSLQQQFDSGARTFQAGRYTTGLRITKGADVDMTGVVIAGAVDTKAGVLVQTSEPVTVRNLTASGLKGGGNTAAIKVEGANFNLSVIGGEISECEMGVLTDNKGGTLVIDGTYFHDTGNPGADLGHSIYAGEIDQLTVRNVTVYRSKNYGHLVKSRAKVSLIENNKLAGLDGKISRAMDFARGGDVTVRGNVIQQGPGDTNPEMIGFALETQNGQWLEQTALIEGNTFISDVTNRPQSSVVAAVKFRTATSTNSDGTVSPVPVVKFNNNRLVWADGGFLKGVIGYSSPAESVGNQEFFGRAAAGLQPYPALN